MSLSRINPDHKSVNSQKLDESLTVLQPTDYHALDKISNQEKRQLDEAVEKFLVGPFKDSILITIDLQATTIRPIYHLVYSLVNDRYPDMFPSGLSIAAKTNDNKPIVINRSKANSDNIGAIGPIAGFVKTTKEELSKDKITLRYLIENQVVKELGHEAWIPKEKISIDWSSILEIKSNYPRNQKEYCIKTSIDMSLDEIINTELYVIEGEEPQPKEDVINIDNQEIINRLRTTNCASQHAFALLVSIGWNPDQAAKFIEELPIPQKK